ncbi:BnaA07g24760D [Brassica napus]|uniref:Uncharacterized protein n=2 Tax=Brassica TaxID=3705 RepID=M4CIL3_BRACM|nr:unnamed protein product [Brassica napus]CDY07397.1 BnaA07g24760D [Brassica napus]VDD01072.1 unnamed protein product [Brassica rapa]
MTSEYRPRVIVNGTRTFHYFYCRNCSRTVQPRNNGLYGPLCPLCSREINLHDQLDVMRPYWELDADTDTDHELVNTDELVDVMPNERVGPPPASLFATEVVKTVTITEEDLAKEKVCAICNRGV